MYANITGQMRLFQTYNYSQHITIIFVFNLTRLKQQHVKFLKGRIQNSNDLTIKMVCITVKDTLQACVMQ